MSLDPQVLVDEQTVVVTVDDPGLRLEVLEDGTVVNVDEQTITLQVLGDPEAVNVIQALEQGPPGTTTQFTYTHIQDFPLDTWLITHNQNRYPSVTVVDSSGGMVDGYDVDYIDSNSMRLTFDGPFSGRAFLN